MNRTYIVILAVVLIAGAAWYCWPGRVATTPPTGDGASQAGTTTTSTNAKLAIDLYPLYSGATWNAAVVQSATIGTTTYSGASMTSTTIDAGMDPGSIFMPFESYYDKLLKERGWQVANDLAAGGHTGGETGYRNGSGVILTSFNIEYSNKPADAPSECPCTVTLSLFSNVTN